LTTLLFPSTFFLLSFSFICLFRAASIGSIYNEGKSAASFCRQMAAWFPDLFCNFYLVKNHKIAINSTTTKAGEKINKHRFVILRILEIF
jgi:hypothetical protein